MSTHREDGALQEWQTDAGKERRRRYAARCRERWRAAGLCLECGRERKPPTLRCPLCLIGNTIRNARSLFKKRMAKMDYRRAETHGEV